MPNHLTRITLLCACSLIASSAAVGQKGGKAGASYHPPIKIEANPATFPLSGTKISVTASVFNKDNSGSHPPGIRLRVVAADASGNFPASGGMTYPSSGAKDPPQPIGSQNWAHWSNATFDNVDVPAPAQKLAMIADYLTWGTGAQQYVRLGGAESHGVAVFRKRCIPVNGKSLCHWQKE
jgi:hypothetical protein